jgi:hypothetical protein
MSAEEVMTISGHLDFRSFKRYAKVTRAAQNNSNGGVMDIFNGIY